MSDTKKIVVDLPIDIYDQLRNIADASAWPIEQVLLQTIRAGMPPLLNKVPEAFHAELLVLNGMGDMDLLRVSEGALASDAPKDELHRKADFDMLRRTYALSLLKWRGHPIPDPQATLV